MNYYRFLDSRDIRNHLENMEYPLSTPEAAYLVWQCHNATLEEKFSAWEEIAKTMSDCPIPRRPGMTGDVSSVHQFLRDYIGLEKNRLEDFAQGENCVFWGGLFPPAQPGVERGRRLVGKRYSVPKLYKLSRLL